jgi:adenylate kinase
MLTERGSEVSGMLELAVPDEMLMERLINRGKTSGRADDNEETIKKRLEIYKTQTSPLIEWYEKEGKRHTVKGHGSLEEINAALCAVIDNF